MSIAALGLILVSAFIHASWNLLLKRTQVPNQTAFTLLFLGVGTLVFLPVAALALWRYGMPAAVWPWAAASVVIEVAYWMLLTRAYQAGEMSAVYPLARGSGALLAALLGLTWLHEPVTPAVVLGIALILLGGLLLNRSTLGGQMPWFRTATEGVRLALLTGLSIGLYSVIDKRATSLGAPVLFYFWLAYAGPALVLILVRGRQTRTILRATWRAAGAAAVTVGILSPLAYLLVLGAMQMAPVSRVAAARELNLVWGTLLGRWVLRERVGPTRLLGAGTIAVGVIALALAR
ncbi:MAG: EamA family transporter [Mycobacterium leprae]